jgi:arylsulfatase A-like enzyme
VNPTPKPGGDPVRESGRRESFLAALTSLWLRLTTVALIALLFLFALQVPEELVGWSFYLSSLEVIFEIGVFAVFVALTAVVLGALCTVAVAPFLLFRQSSRRRIAKSATNFAVASAAFLCLATALSVLIEWAHVSEKPKIAIFACYLIAFALVLLIPRRRKQLVASLDDFLGEKATRRAVIGTGIAAAALVVAEAAMGKMASAQVIPKRAMRPSGPNILLISFDALSAEDMSVYGYRLPTTPHIDQFARNSSVFTNFYSSSTFTTASIATMLTGLLPSEHRVYHILGGFRGASVERTLPRVMRASGYSTGASISNPFAYFLAQGVAADYDALPEPPYRTKDFMHLWNAVRILRQRQPFGSRAEEFRNLEAAFDLVPNHLESHIPRYFARTKSGFPPAGSFEQARQILRGMPDGFFLWVHLFAPHWPYLPEAPNLGRFLPPNEMRTAEDQKPLRFGLLYAPGMQPLVDKARRRYDEFLADADSAFGAFISDLENSGSLRNTAVIASADHGESFEGGIYSHRNKRQNRPEIHIPLIIRMPGQERGSRVEFTADQTSLAPTILDIAGLPRPDWMRGPSLLPWVNRDNEGQGQGLAFTQYLEKNSIFEPISHGTVGVIDGRHQYVLDLDTGKGILHPLAEAESWNLDRSAENPALAQTLREAIYARFPDLPRKPA